MPYVKNKPWITFTRKNKKKNATAKMAQAELALENKITSKDVVITEIDGGCNRISSCNI